MGWGRKAWKRATKTVKKTWDKTTDVAQKGWDVVQDGYNPDRWAGHMNRWGVINDKQMDRWKDFNHHAAAGAMMAGGVVLSPVTGGASLGMTYGALSGYGLSAMNGQGLNGTAAMRGGAWGAAGGAATMAAGGLASGAGIFSTGSGTGISGLTAAGGSTGIPGLATAGRIAGSMGTMGVGGYGAGIATGMSHVDALRFGLGSGLGGAYGIGKYGMTGLGALGTAGAAMAGGMTMNKLGGQPPTDGGAGAGGNYSVKPVGTDAGSGTANQSSATKSVPEAQFLDSGGGDWGNSGLGGVFGGLDNLRKKDKFINTDEVSRQQAQRGLGAFLK